MPAELRIRPGTRREIGLVNTVVTRTLGAFAGTNPPNVFTTLARHRRMFRPWLRFASTLMPAGSLPRADTELVILRVAHLCGCAYETDQHVGLARRAGLTDAQIAATSADPVGPAGPSAQGALSAHQRLLLRVTDELVGTRTLGDGLWEELHAELSDVDCLELWMLVGHYVMLAMTINAAGTPLDTHRPGRPSKLLVALQDRAQARLQQRARRPRGRTYEPEREQIGSTMESSCT